MHPLASRLISFLFLSSFTYFHIILLIYFHLLALHYTALGLGLSGQCFSSEAWGGRSANRGQCAQACRMPYGLIGAYVRSSFLLYSARIVCHIISYHIISCCVMLCRVVLCWTKSLLTNTTHGHTHTPHTHTHTVNGSLVELLDDVKYLLSPQDLMAIDYVPELVVAGTVYYSVV